MRLLNVWTLWEMLEITEISGWNGLSEHVYHQYPQHIVRKCRESWVLLRMMLIYWRYISKFAVYGKTGFKEWYPFGLMAVPMSNRSFTCFGLRVRQENRRGRDIPVELVYLVGSGGTLWRPMALQGRLTVYGFPIVCSLLPVDGRAWGVSENIG